MMLFTPYAPLTLVASNTKGGEEVVNFIAQIKNTSEFKR